MVSYRQLLLALRALDLDRNRPVLAHASLSAFGQVTGGAEAVVGVLVSSFQTVIMPTFTYKTMLTPEVGPPNNGLVYSSAHDANTMAEFFHAGLPADKLMGIVPETLRKLPNSGRSNHPILSFSGINAEEILGTQSVEEPLAPIDALIEQEGWVLLLGVDHTTNTSIHFGEYLAGRKNFTRWGLTRHAALQCLRFPPCSDGFNGLTPYLDMVVRTSQAGEALIQAFAVRDLVAIVRAQVEANPFALLCDKPECPRCTSVREDSLSRFRDTGQVVG